jgi:chloramphenicol 3-O-phosphotransferase
LLLKNHQVYYVKVNCELPTMEEREMLRGDRAWGLARDQFAKMKKLDEVWKYDLEVDTTVTNPFANA